MKRLFGFTFVFSLFVMCSCTNTIMVGQARPPTTPDAVRIYSTPPRHYERIALINSSSGPTWGFTTRSQEEDAIAKIKEEAAKLGANGVLLEGIDTRSSGNLGIGVGGFGTGGGYHSGYAVGGSGAFGAPILHKTVHATAIFVR